MKTATAHPGENEVAILARILGNEDGQLSDDFARYILAHEISERDKARMHELAVRDQNGELTPEEKEELFGFEGRIPALHPQIPGTPGRAGLQLLATRRWRTRMRLRWGTIPPVPRAPSRPGVSEDAPSEIEGRARVRARNGPEC